MTNYIKTFGLMALMTALMVGIAGWFGGRQGAMIAFAFAVLFNFGSYWFSDRLVLRMYRARKVDRTEAPELYAMVDRLRRRAELPMPALAITPTDQPNAFATGRSPQHAVVAVTQGLLETVRGEELEGILAHELAHIRHRDMLTGTVAATMSAAIVMIARFGFFFGGDRDRGGGLSSILMLILAPLAAFLIQMAISRAAEYRADRTAGELTGDPRALASALLSLQRGARRHPLRVNPSAAHLAIVNPLPRGAGQAIGALFRTHPPTAERVRRLEEQAAGSA